MLEYIDLTCASIRFFKDLFGFWPGGSRYLICTKVTDNDQLHSWTGFTHWMQACTRERYPFVPHHVAHAWIWFTEDAPIKFLAEEREWVQEGLPTFYEAELTARLTGEEMWLGLHYIHHLILRRAAQAGLLEKDTVKVYAIGHMRALALDRAIREATDNQRSIDDLMSLLGRRYGEKKRHFNRQQMLQAINEVAGKDLTNFYNRYMAGEICRELPPVEEFIEEYEDHFFAWVDS